MASTLKNLNAYGDCGINQGGIRDLQSIELQTRNNTKIKNVSHMASILKILGANGRSGIDQKGKIACQNINH
jgi:hypothetical protein